MSPKKTRPQKPKNTKGLNAPVQLDLSLNRAFGAEDVHVADLEAVRTVLSGRSLIDSETLHFRSRKSVAQFLKLLCCDVKQEADRQRLLQILKQSAEHLRLQHGFQIPPEFEELSDPLLPFLWASSPGPLFRASLMLVKVAHVINHVDARELRHQLAISDSDLFALANERVMKFGDMLRDTGVGVVILHASEKPKQSTILKLLAKRQTIAAQIHDRIRFRIIVNRRGDVLPSLLMMTRHLFPFNYILPNESRNDLLSFAELLEAMDRLHPGLDTVKDAILRERTRPNILFRNEFSHPDFLMINFVVDLPLRIDRFMDRGSPEIFSKYGKTVFLLVEFQVYDLATFQRNEIGPSSHAHYKARQRRAILRRLVGGEALENWRHADTKSNELSSEGEITPHEEEQKQ